MDRPEIVAQRGYETFAEHYMNAGIKKGEEKGITKGLNIPTKINRHSGMAKTARPEYRILL